MVTETIEYQRDKAKRIQNLIYSYSFRLNHDETCQWRLHDYADEWQICDCDLSEILAIVGRR